MPATKSKPVAKAVAAKKSPVKSIPAVGKQGAAPLTEARKRELEKLITDAGNMRLMTFELTGLAPLLPHRFDEKARRQMLESQMGAARSKTKQPKVPVRDAVNALYFLDAKPEIPQEYLDATADEVAEEMPLPFLQGCRFGIKASSFKRAMVRAGKLNGFKMTDAAASLFVRSAPDHTELVHIVTDEPPVMRCDFVKVQMTTDLRFRCELRNWRCSIDLEYNASVFSEEQVIAMLSDSGRGVGVGDWRPERHGAHGAFQITGISFPAGDQA